MQEPKGTEYILQESTLGLRIGDVFRKKATGYTHQISETEYVGFPADFVENNPRWFKPRDERPTTESKTITVSVDKIREREETIRVQYGNILADNFKQKFPEAFEPESQCHWVIAEMDALIPYLKSNTQNWSANKLQEIRSAFNDDATLREMK